MTRATRFAVGSMIAAILVAVVWLHAPVVPALLGAGGAALVVHRRQRRQSPP